MVSESTRARIHGQGYCPSVLWSKSRDQFSDCFQHPAVAAKWGMNQHIEAMVAAGVNVNEVWQKRTALQWAAQV